MLLVRTPDTELRLGQGTFAVAVNDDGLTEFLAYNGPVKIASLGPSPDDYGAEGRLIHAILRGNEIELLHDQAGQPARGLPKLTGLDCGRSILDGPERDGEPGGGGEGSGGHG